MCALQLYFTTLNAGLTRSQYHLHGPGIKIVHYFVFKCQCVSVVGYVVFIDLMCPG